MNNFHFNFQDSVSDINETSQENDFLNVNKLTELYNGLDLNVLIRILMVSNFY